MFIGVFREKHVYLVKIKLLNLHALWVMSAEEQRLPAVVSDTLVRLALYVAALPVSTQHTRFKVLQSDNKG